MTLEGAVLKTILDLLAAERVLAWRMNTGAAKYGEQIVRFGTPGFADILAVPTITGRILGFEVCWTTPLFIEVKAEKGRQSIQQRFFENQVKDAGCHYILARSADDVSDWLRRNGHKKN